MYKSNRSSFRCNYIISLTRVTEVSTTSNPTTAMQTGESTSKSLSSGMVFPHSKFKSEQILGNRETLIYSATTVATLFACLCTIFDFKFSWLWLKWDLIYRGKYFSWSDEIFMNSKNWHNWMNLSKKFLIKFIDRNLRLYTLHLGYYIAEVSILTTIHKEMFRACPRNQIRSILVFQ